jgi:hypothetical protein
MERGHIIFGCKRKNTSTTELGMSTSGRSGPCGTYSDISKDDLCTVR